MEKNNNVALIGVGLMGKGIGYNILKKGYKLFLLKGHSQENIDSLVNAGAVVLDDVEELCENSQQIILCLPSAKEVKEVCIGEVGLLNYIKESTTIFDCTTSHPEMTIELSKLFSKRKVQFIDAPLTRTPTEAMEGRLNCILGAKQDDIDTTLLSSFCENVFFTEKVGDANFMKLINNGLTLCATAIVGELMSAAMDLDVDLIKLREIVSKGGANSAQFQGITNWLIEGNNDALKFSLKNAMKDIRYLDDITKDCPREMQLLKKIYEFYEETSSKKGKESTLPQLCGHDCGSFRNTKKRGENGYER